MRKENTALCAFGIIDSRSDCSTVLVMRISTITLRLVPTQGASGKANTNQLPSVQTEGQFPPFDFAVWPLKHIIILLSIWVIIFGGVAPSVLNESKNPYLLLDNEAARVLIRRLFPTTYVWSTVKALEVSMRTAQTPLGLRSVSVTLVISSAARIRL